MRAWGRFVLEYGFEEIAYRILDLRSASDSEGGCNERSEERGEEQSEEWKVVSYSGG